MQDKWHPGISSSFFSFHVFFFSGKIRTNPCPKFMSPLFPALESLVVFLISIFVGATAQHPQHTDDKEGSRKGVVVRGVVGQSKSRIYCARRKRRGKKRKKNRGKRRDNSMNKSILSTACFITKRLSITFHDFSWPFLSKGENVCYERKM